MCMSLLSILSTKFYSKSYLGVDFVSMHLNIDLIFPYDANRVAYMALYRYVYKYILLLHIIIYVSVSM